MNLIRDCGLYTFKERSDAEVYTECHTELVEVPSRSTKRYLRVIEIENSVF